MPRSPLFQKLSDDERYIVAQGLLNPTIRLLMESEIRRITNELSHLALPEVWDYPSLVTFAKRYQAKLNERQHFASQLDMIADAQAHIDNLQQMEKSA